ncbi:MAG: rubrerythrin family protein [Candidatus Omnitrophica bacterium]|nr:rubrerythrin family protein [Candidatus Omnitrophota bacterium]
MEMHKMTQQNLLNAFSGESQAHMKYLIFSEIAEKEKKPNISRLFKAIAYAEQVHARNHLQALGMIKNTPDNLEVAIQGETFEVEEMYPVYNQDAKFQNEKEAERSTHYALEAEKIHAVMYKKAKEIALKDKDIELADIYICPVCGYTVEGKVPEYCPICGVEKKLFKKF